MKTDIRRRPDSTTIEMLRVEQQKSACWSEQQMFVNFASQKINFI